MSGVRRSLAMPTGYDSNDDKDNEENKDNELE